MKGAIFIMRWLKHAGGLVPVLIGVACAYPSNFANDIAHMGDPTYDDCRRNADPLSNYGARCANEADPKVIAAKAEQVRQAAEQQRLATQAAQQRAAAQDSAEAARGYSRTTVRDFRLDGKDLASRSARLSVSGIYMPAGNLELLFGSQLDAIQFSSGNVQFGSAIGLQTGDATRDFRSQLLNCRSNPAAAISGCPVRILGTATTCVVTTSFGERQETPCIAVDEGSFGGT